MVHVDSPAILFLESRTVLILPMSNNDKFLTQRMVLGGAFLLGDC
jgi:hypothetical protein